MWILPTLYPIIKNKLYPSGQTTTPRFIRNKYDHRGGLDLRVERLGKFLAQPDQLLAAAHRMGDEPGSAPRGRRVESYIRLAERGVPRGDRPGMEAIVRGNGMHEPATGGPHQYNNSKAIHQTR